jgi:hypothetical protein
LFYIIGLELASRENPHNNAMHAELAAVPDSLYNVTRANRVIASVSMS